jgi:hypothetical protein
MAVRYYTPTPKQENIPQKSKHLAGRKARFFYPVAPRSGLRCDHVHTIFTAIMV